MAQLPPKIPSNIMTHPNWPPSFPPHHRMPPLTTVPPSQQPPSWMDDFLDYSSVKRGSHRRSMSDSIAFLDGGGAGGGNGGGCSGGGGFDRLDDEQLMSMFSDEFSAGINGMVDPPSSPSDQNSDNDEDPMSTGNGNGDNRQQPPKSEPGEVESSCNTHNLLSASASAAHSDKNDNQTSDGEPIFDAKRVKRILANRQSAQRSRVRKLQYISELERSVTSLQTEVSALSPRVAFLDHQRLILNVDNSSLKQRLAALAQDKIFKDAHQEALKREIERLRQIYQHQQNKMGNNAADHHTMGCTDKEQLMT